MGAAAASLRLRVVPGARRPGIVGRYGDAWKVRVAAAPEHGKANDAVLELLSKTLAVPRRDVSIASGHSARDKTIALDGLTLAEAERRLAAKAAGAEGS